MAMRRRSAGSLLLASVLLFSATAAQPAGNRVPLPARPCWSDLLERPTSFIDKVPVGCETVDCCPGCPRASALDWRIRVTGNAVEAMDLSFANLSASSAASVQPTGKVRRERDGIFRATPGVGTLKGLPLITDASPPVATLTVAWNRAFRPQERGPNRVDIVLEQMLGAVVVSESAVSFDIRNCPTPIAAPGDDSIELTNNLGNDSAVIVMSTRRTGTACSDFEYKRANSNVGVGKVMTNGACESSVAVFSDDNAMALALKSPAWTDNGGDKLTIPLETRIKVPVTIWVANDAMWKADMQVPAEPVPLNVPQGFIPQNALGIANTLFNDNNVGIRFAATLKDIRDNPDVIKGFDKCAAAASLKDPPMTFFAPNQINVYYIPLQWDTGRNCAPEDRDIIIIGSDPLPSTLAHELGHALSLGHFASPAENIMGGLPTRKVFTEGQAFRMNMQCTSEVSLMGLRPGVTPWRCKGDTLDADDTSPLNCPQTLAIVPSACPELSHNEDPK